MYFGTTPYGQEGHIEHNGDGNMLREETFGQPNTLQPGDVLANGLVVAEDNFEAGNGGVGLNFTDGSTRVVAARIPLLLEGGTSGKLPADLAVGDIFETGCVVLSPPQEISRNDINYSKNRHEILVNMTGGFSGSPVGLPRDLVVALHGETYPPSLESPLGALAVEQTLKMGARARKHLPNYGRLTDEAESDRVAGVFDSLDSLRTRAQAEKAVYQQTLSEMKKHCEQLKGVELFISGRLNGRGGTTVFSTDPRSQVQKLHIEVWSATVNAFEGGGSPGDQHLPFIQLYGRTTVGDEQISARLGVGDIGVTAEIVDDSQTNRQF